MKPKKSDKLSAEWQRLCSKMMKNNVRVSIPRAFLPILTLFFHHVSDAMGGDDRPDHGLAKMRQGREHYKIPFYFLYGKLRRAETRMSNTAHRQAARLFYRYFELLEEKHLDFRKRLERAREFNPEQ